MSGSDRKDAALTPSANAAAFLRECSLGRMGFRYQLRLADGADAGEVELAYQPDAGEHLRVDGNRRMHVLAVVPTPVVEEFVDRPLYGILEVEPIVEHAPRVRSASVSNDFEGLLAIARAVVRESPPNPLVLKNVAWALGEHYATGRPSEEFIGAPHGHDWDSEWPLYAANRLVEAIDTRAADGLDLAEMVAAVRDVLHPGSVEDSAT